MSRQTDRGPKHLGSPGPQSDPTPQPSRALSSRDAKWGSPSRRVCYTPQNGHRRRVANQQEADGRSGHCARGHTDVQTRTRGLGGRPRPCSGRGRSCCGSEVTQEAGSSPGRPAFSLRDRGGAADPASMSGPPSATGDASDQGRRFGGGRAAGGRRVPGDGGSVL